MSTDSLTNIIFNLCSMRLTVCLQLYKASSPDIRSSPSRRRRSWTRSTSGCRLRWAPPTTRLRRRRIRALRCHLRHADKRAREIPRRTAPPEADVLHVASLPISLLLSPFHRCVWSLALSFRDSLFPRHRAYEDLTRLAIRVVVLVDP